MADDAADAAHATHDEPDAAGAIMELEPIQRQRKSEGRKDPEGQGKRQRRRSHSHSSSQRQTERWRQRAEQGERQGHPVQMLREAGMGTARQIAITWVSAVGSAEKTNHIAANCRHKDASNEASGDPPKEKDVSVEKEEWMCPECYVFNPDVHKRKCMKEGCDYMRPKKLYKDAVVAEMQPDCDYS